MPRSHCHEYATRMQHECHNFEIRVHSCSFGETSLLIPSRSYWFVYCSYCFWKFVEWARMYFAVWNIRTCSCTNSNSYWIRSSFGMFSQRSCNDSCPFVMFVGCSYLIRARTHHERSTKLTRIFTNHHERVRMQHEQSQPCSNFTRISPNLSRIERDVTRIRSRMNKNKQELTRHQYEIVGIPYECCTNISRICRNMSRT